MGQADDDILRDPYNGAEFAPEVDRLELAKAILSYSEPRGCLLSNAS